MKLEVKDASIGYKKQVLSSNINMASEPGMVTAISDKMAAVKQHCKESDEAYTMVRWRRHF